MTQKLTLCALSGRRWLNPLPLPDMAALSSLARVDDTHWLIAGRGADVHARSRNGDRVLMRAIHDRDKVKLLLDQGAQVENRPMVFAATLPGSRPTLELLLGSGSGCGNYSRTGELGDLNRCRADAAGGSLHQHVVPGFDPAVPVQHAPRRDKRQRSRGPFHKRPRIAQGDDVPRTGHGEFTEASLRVFPRNGELTAGGVAARRARAQANRSAACETCPSLDTAA